MCREAIDTTTNGNKPLDDVTHYLENKKGALKKGLKNAKTDLRDVRDSEGVGEMLSKVARHANKHSMAAGRVLVSLYFLNVVMDRLIIWWSKSYNLGGHKVDPFTFDFPWLAVYLLMPSALAVGINFKTHIFSGVLVCDILYHDVRGMYNLIYLFFKRGHQPSEHMMKEVAMLGCTALLLAQGFKERRQDRLAGLILEVEKKAAGVKKSAVLLFGRVLMAGLFFYIGYLQLEFIRENAGKEAEPLAYSADGHNNNWVLLQLALSVPFLFGFHTRKACLLLALVLLAEAVTCWTFWSNAWGPLGEEGAELGRPLWWYTMHARRHFVANMAMAGGLLLLRSFGPGRFTLDAMLKRD